MSRDETRRCDEGRRMAHVSLVALVVPHVTLKGETTEGSTVISETAWHGSIRSKASLRFPSCDHP